MAAPEVPAFVVPAQPTTPAPEPAPPTHARTSDEVFDALDRLDEDVTAMRSEITRIAEPLVRVLKQNQHVAELQAQLRRAEKVAQAWHDWPIITGLHDAVLMLRQTPDADPHLLEHLEGLIFAAGVEEYGKDGDAVEPEEADIIAASGSGGSFVVTVCRRPGLRIGPVPLRKPIVEVTRKEGTAG